MTKQESLDQVRSEFSKVVKESSNESESNIDEMSKKEILKQYLTLENQGELLFLNQVMMESLRLQPPTYTTSEYTLSQDAKIGKYNLKAADGIIINLQGLHRNADQWQKPNDFIPERFDINDPLSLTPAGKKRHPMSWAAFNGGKRMCFGKALAEIFLKFTATYMSQNFNMEYVETDKYPDTNSLPKAQLGQSEMPPIPVRLTKF